MKTPSQTSLRYEDAGVNIDAGNRLVEKIKQVAKRTHRPEVLNGLGGFAALFEIPLDRYKKPILVSSTDGVGTKLKLAIELQKYDTIGIDLVAMCVNDLIVMGAEPLFFLDYYACGQLNVDQAYAVIKGIGQGCEIAGISLVGGETAEMPGLYTAQDYDLAGFCVGIVEKDRIIDGSQVKAGDALIGIASSGVHSNGYSLVHKILEHTGTSLSKPWKNKTLGEALLEPTRIYVKPILKLLQHLPIHAMAHITGGGIVENLPRVLPDNCKAVIEKNAWTRPAIFDWLQEAGHVESHEMLRTFNCGIGMILCIPENQVENCLNLLKAEQQTAWRIGSIQNKNANEHSVEMV